MEKWIRVGKTLYNLKWFLRFYIIDDNKDGSRNNCAIMGTTRGSSIYNEHIVIINRLSSKSSEIILYKIHAFICSKLDNVLTLEGSSDD